MGNSGATNSFPRTSTFVAIRSYAGLILTMRMRDSRKSTIAQSDSTMKS